MVIEPEKAAGKALATRILLNSDGRPFDDLAAIARALEPLTNEGRMEFRNANATAVAEAIDSRLLVIAGPGAGKTRLFLSRIRYWLAQHPGESIYVASFVRKLVNDLRVEIKAEIDDELHRRIEVTTLHTLARSIIERNNGSRGLPLREYVRVIGRPWDEVIWADTLAFRPDLQGDMFKRSEHDRQLHTETLEKSAEWTELRLLARRLCRFFNAVGFAHMISIACEAVAESPKLMRQKFWILDEYQDFNNAEDSLVRLLTQEADGLLIAGDDEQALYQEMKASRPEIIIGHYNDGSFANAMLPFCGRCTYYVCRAAAAFIEKHRSVDSIEKIYMPLVVDNAAPRVRVVATPHPMSAVDYIDNFMSEKAEEYAKYLARVADGGETDPFLLILSQNGCLTRTKGSDADRALFELVGKFTKPTFAISADYSKVITYAIAGWHEGDNFAVRKVLDYEDVTIPEVHEYIVEAIDRSATLADVVNVARPDSLDRARRVAGILDSDGLTPDEMTIRLGEILPLKDPDALAADLKSHPIKSSAAREDEDDAAIDLGGVVEPVALMTMFRAKGLSAHHVMVVGCDDANMDRTGELPFYVALTRSRGSLHLLMARQAGGAKDLHPFVWDLPEECCEYVTYKKERRVTEFLNGKEDLLAQLKKWRLGAEYGRRRAQFRKQVPMRSDGSSGNR